MIDWMCRYFFWFLLYSFLGWVTETLLYMLRDRKVVKRGFLFGPVCPIYGFACCICVLILYGRIDNPVLLFLAGMGITTALEYATHFVMEKVFHAMWWDYSNRRFNIKGRIYLKGCLFFGVLILLEIKVIQPAFVMLTDMIPPTALRWICFALYTVLLLDVATMVSDLKGTAFALKSLQNEMLTAAQERVDQTGEQLDNAKKAVMESEVYRRIKENPWITRFKKKYPDFTFKKYKYILDAIKDPPQENKGRTDITLYGTAETLPSAEQPEPEGKKAKKKKTAAKKKSGKNPDAKKTAKKKKKKKHK
ncbi:MAG: putative ABC transporter permease [Clostridia bacterium]|nr:putative ABC transporter permease [Clostridia bacterium]